MTQNTTNDGGGGIAKRDMLADVLIRAAEPDDAPGATALMNLPGYRWGTMRLPYQSESVTRQRMSAGGPSFICLVAILEENVIGMASLSRFDGRRSHAGSIGMGVHDEYVGQGLGTRLLSTLLGVADDWWALRRIELTVNADNTRAIDLYKRMGFEREGLLRNYALRGGVLVDAVSMARLREAAIHS